MASGRVATIARKRRQIPPQGHTEKPRGIQKAKRRSLRGPSTQNPLQKKPISQTHSGQDLQHSAGNVNRLDPPRTRKRAREVEDPENHIPTERPRKRLHEDSGWTLGQEAASHISASQRSHISHWLEKKNWPTQLFQPDNMFRALARKKSEASLRRKRSEASFTTISDQRAEKNAPYRDPSYETQLEKDAGSFMNEYKQGITDASEKLCQSLLENPQSSPNDTIFRDDAFQDTCQRLRGKNEARIFKDITPLIVPSIEPLATLSVARFDIAVESVNEGWNSSRPLTKPRPQPDYAVGFKRLAFSEDQLTKLRPLLAENTSYDSLFMGTYYMYFPFLTCEVKCGAVGLDIADRQNLHSMTLAVRAIVELFRLVNRAEELHREVLAFSVSHDHESVRIYGHFPVIEGPKTTYWRYPLRKYDFTERKGMERWTAYTFTKNVYDIFMPAIFKRICSAIDDLPFEFKTLEQRSSEHSGLSQQFESHGLSESVQQGSQVQATPSTSTEEEKPAPRKKKK